MSEKDHFNEKDRKTSDAAPMDNPEQVKTDKKTLHEMHEEEMNVDAIPLEDLKQDMEDEANPRETKDSSSSDEK
ncbi:hypothetical protein [Planococcus sp. ISL-109]|uniref:hypothetical protein n=1 Tax=Planococcus sp. ISL-109 TaxID=2819166 RepID=UPI001BE641F6|nr:hypothetical protein [Planococcus sp. ISL-109]MBT2583516.1 hypothetical protein [Planococcus sp. ISL-109]